jgi:hypothetical protein
VESVAVFDHREAWNWVVERVAGGQPALALIEAPRPCLAGRDKQPQLCEAARTRGVDGGAMELSSHPDAPVIAPDKEV